MSKKQILVVDDSFIMRTIIKDIVDSDPELEVVGFAENGKVGLERVRELKPDAIVLYTTLLWVPMSLLPALWFWEWPRGIIWLWIVLSGLFGTLGHMLWTRALKLADASLLTPISFIQVLVVAVYGYFLFGEVLDGWTALGAGIIFASNLYIARRESVLARRAVTDPEIGGDSQSPR